MVPTKFSPSFLLCVLCLLGHSEPADAEEPLPQVERLKTSPVLRNLLPNPVRATSDSAAHGTLKQMHVPKGFMVELIASEPRIHQPIAFAWDAAGRIWVAEAYSYPVKRPSGEGLDKIVLFEDVDGDGRFETRKVFAEGLNLVSGLEIGFGGVWVGAAPELLFIPDMDGDDRPDGPPQVLLDGFGYQDTHETLNSFLWGPDGWLYGIQGVFNTARIGRPDQPVEERPELRAGVWRYHPVRHEFEIFAHGGSNPWGLDYDENGQILMTHCRSYWGKGPTTLVIQGGQFWNQVNAKHASYIVANPPHEFPEFRNYLLASARYGHGAGGAGPRGSDAIYGGHSHVGTMIYLGDNWPESHRGRLFTHNLGGHQINQQINLTDGSGYNTIHAGEDVLFCTDPSYVAVDLQYGPDGAVYMIDWVDPQHCHNPNSERWDRTNGRIYRMQWEPTFRPVKVNLRNAGNQALLDALDHPNHWYGRVARRLLQERSAPSHEESVLTETQVQSLVNKALSSNRQVSLNALWALHVTGNLKADTLQNMLNHGDSMVRSWSIQLAVEQPDAEPGILSRLIALAREDSSPVVQRYLASAVPRLPSHIAWRVVGNLARHANLEDPNIPLLIWHGLAPRMERDPQRAFALAEEIGQTRLSDWIYWYGATLDSNSVESVVRSLVGLEGMALHKRLAGLWMGVSTRANMEEPPSWPMVAGRLYVSDNMAIRRYAERTAAVFGDRSVFPGLRRVLNDPGADSVDRRHAFEVLARALDEVSLSSFIGLLQGDDLKKDALAVLGRFESAEVSNALIRLFAGFDREEQHAALLTLTGRVPYAKALLDAVEKKEIPGEKLTAFHIRRLAALREEGILERVERVWGRIGNTPEELNEQIRSLEIRFNEAPLWAYSAHAGRAHFENLCSQCHVMGDLGNRIGPDLSGAGKHGVRYYLENILDPNAVVGTDFQMTEVDTRDGELISGLMVGETESSILLKTTLGENVVLKAEIASLKTVEESMMPMGLLDALNDREQIELLKFLLSN